MITFRHVSKRYADGTVAVEDLTLEVGSGELVVLLGTSGSGKTTALRMVNRLVAPTSGTVTLGGQDVAEIPVHELRRGIGYVIQQPGLFPHRTVAQNIATVPRLLGWDKNRQQARALELLELVGLDVNLAGRYPSQLSGGQQQRVGVARALAADPPVLLMDEPFGALDPVGRAALQQEFLMLQRHLGTTVLFVTHDVDEAALLGHRVAVLGTGGKLAQYAPPDELLSRPADPFVAEFLGRSRGLRLLSLLPASELPAQRLPTGGLAGWTLQLDPAGRPTGWTAGDGATSRFAVEPVTPDGSMRDLLDSALTSPVRTAVRVDASGRLLGVVALAAIVSRLGGSPLPGTGPAVKAPRLRPAAHAMDPR
jgi:osmoprotectant transport system ATP-binding protein